MEKLFKKIVLLGLALLMLVCFTACVDDQDNFDVDTADTTVEKVEMSSKDEKAEKEIKAYIAIQQSELDEAIKTLKEQGIDLEISVDGSSLVYEYKLGFSVPQESIKQMEEGIKSSESTLREASDTIFSECKAVEEMVYIYYDAEDTLLCELSFER